VTLTSIITIATGGSHTILFLLISLLLLFLLLLLLLLLLVLLLLLYYYIVTGGSHTTTITTTIITYYYYFYRWFLHYITIIITNTDRWFSHADTGRLLVREGTLVLPNVQQSDAGSYFCNASNAHGSEVMEVKLSVTAPLSAHVHPPR
jgi:hypothetical protein